MNLQKGIYLKFLCLALSIALSCKEGSQVNFPPIVNNLDIQFTLLNENGVSSTTFYPGENFVFSLIVKNNSDERLVLRGFDYEDFCRVTRLESYDPTENGEQNNDMGKPYVNMFCSYVAGHMMLPKTDLKFQIHWIPPKIREVGSPYGAFFCIAEENPPLSPGRYGTGFQTKFLLSYEGEDIETDLIQFNIEFEVK